MHKKQVAVLDVGSSKITVVVGERGVNKTFIIKGKKSFEYEGFADGVFFDVDQLKSVLSSAIEYLKSVKRQNIEMLYIGVPGEFTRVTVKDAQISFDRKKKITEVEIEKLFDSAFVVSGSSVLINRSAIRYELDDLRRLANPIGCSSEILKGKLTFIVCQNYFIEVFDNILNGLGIKQKEYVSSSLAQAMYLIEPETRDRIAMLLDVGYITTTFTLIQGDGILYQKSFSFGGGYLTASIAEKYSLDFSVAEELKRKVNMCKVSQTDYDTISTENGEFYSAEELIKIVKENLDLLCEKVADAIDDTGYVIPEYVPLFVTGGGISYMRGAKGHIANRLGLSVEVVSPRVPLMNNPIESSLLSLMDLTL